jgi:hypothetical protein
LNFNLAQVTTIGRFLANAPLRTMFYAVHGRDDSALDSKPPLSPDPPCSFSSVISVRLHVYH